MGCRRSNVRAVGSKIIYTVWILSCKLNETHHIPPLNNHIFQADFFVHWYNSKVNWSGGF
jgi:hypothetical protein